MPDLRAVKQWKFNELREQRFKALSDKYTLYRYQGIVVDTLRNQIMELPIKDFDQAHLVHKSMLLAIWRENRLWLFNLRNQTTESEIALPDRIVSLTSCQEGGEITVLCASNHLI